MALAIREVFIDIKCEAVNTVILAPKTLLSNWVGQMEAHLETVPFHVCWDSTKKDRDWFRSDMDNLVRNGGVFLVNIEAFGTKNEMLESYLRMILKKPTLVILDESSKVKDQSAHRTKYIAKTFQDCKFKLALTGTLTANSPLDVYGQFLFLKPTFWSNCGFRTWHLFNNFFAVLVDAYGQAGRTYKKVAGYRKLEQLGSLISPYITVINKDEVLDLPEKVFETVSVKLSPPEEKAYQDLKKHMMTILSDGSVIAIEQKVTLYQMFRQICGGWIDPLQPVTDTPAKLEALLELVSDTTDQMVIFAVYTHEINQIAAALGPLARKYDGSVPISERQGILDDFNAKRLRFLVVQPLAGAFGLNLQANCNTIVYYSRPNSPEVFQQSQDRIHRIGQTQTCFYIDIVASGKIDEKVIAALDNHEDLSKQFSNIRAYNIDDYT